MDINLMKKVLKRVEKNHKNFNMDWFRLRLNKKQQVRFPALGCGTICCLAGDIIIEALGEKIFLKLDESAIPRVAQAVAGLSDEDKNALFYLGNHSIYEREGLFDKKPGTRDYARTVIKCVKSYVLEHYGQKI